MNEKELSDFVAGLVVREVEWSASLTRELGFKFPKDYEFGLSTQTMTDRLTGIRIHLVISARINEFKYSFVVELGDLEAAPLRIGKEIGTGVGQLIQGYISAHPEIYPERSDAVEIKSLLEQVNSDDILRERVDQSLKAATFTPVKAP